MRRLFFLVCIAFLAGGSSTGFADIDYQCLHACVNQGKTSQSCMQDCAYNPPHANSSGKPIAKRPTNHRVFNAPVDAEGMLVVKKPSPHVEAPAKDYMCMKECLSNSTTYALCEKQCRQLAVTNPTANQSRNFPGAPTSNK